MLGSASQDNGGYHARFAGGRYKVSGCWIVPSMRDDLRALGHRLHHTNPVLTRKALDAYLTKLDQGGLPRPRKPDVPQDQCFNQRIAVPGVLYQRLVAAAIKHRCSQSDLVREAIEDLLSQYADSADGA